MDTTGNGLYLLRPYPEDCKCDVHNFEIEKARYRQSIDKKRKHYDELIKVNCEMTNLMSSMRDMKETMKSIYKMDYEKKGLSVTQYRPLIAAIDLQVELPIIMPVIDLKNTYKDPTRFRSSAMESLTIQPVKTTCLLRDKWVPETCSFWDELFTGCSEYMDIISKIGLTNMRHQQQYFASFPVLKKTE